MGVTVAQCSSLAFRSAFMTSVAAALGITASAVSVTSITSVTARRSLAEDEPSSLRALASTSSVKVSYSVSTAASKESVTTSITNSAPTLTNSLNTVGATEGFVASAGAIATDTSTSFPTSAPAYAPIDNNCFAGTETVQLESGDIKAIADVRVGDRVLAASAAGKTSYSEVRLTILCSYSLLTSPSSFTFKHLKL